MFKLIKQHDMKDCGAACFSMICLFYNLRLPMAKIRKIVNSDCDGTSIYGIVKGAECVGFKAEALCGNREELISAVNTKDAKLPFIARVIIDETQEHFVVVYRVTANRIFIADPDVGKKSLSYNKFFSIWSGHIVTFEKTESFKEGNYTSSVTKAFKGFLSKNKLCLTGILLFSIIINTVSILGAFLLQIVVESVSTNDLYRNNLVFICVSIIILYLFQGIVAIVRNISVSKLAMKIDQKLMLSFFNHLVELRIEDVRTRKTGELISRFADASNIRRALCRASVSLFLDSIMILSAIAILFILSEQLFYLSIIFVVLYFMVIILFLAPIRKTNEKILENNSQVISYLKESICVLPTIKAFSAEDEVKEKTKTRINKFLKSCVKGTVVGSCQENISYMIASVGAVCLLLRGAQLSMNGIISIGTLLTFHSIFTYLLNSVRNIINLQPDIQVAAIANERLRDILDLDCECGDDVEIDPTGDINFVDVDFRYGYGNLVLDKINLTIKHGECVAIVGESGSGKTTIANLLMGLYQPGCGAITIGGKDISKANPKHIRNQISYVSQTTDFFTDTVRNNLVLGNKNISDDEIEEACRLSKAADFIKELPLGYNTIIGENGISLSRGELQRLSIARALLKKSKILILDEATSNLDSITEKAIKKMIHSLHGEVTIIVIAHRLNTIKNCDSICVLGSGKILERGTHEELMENRGSYYNLYNNY